MSILVMANLTLDEKVNYLKDRTLYMEKLSSDENYLFSELNGLNNSVLDALLAENESGKTRPVKAVRWIIANELKKKTVITKQFTEQLKQKITEKDSSFLSRYLDESTINSLFSNTKSGSFNSYKQHFNLLITFFYRDEAIVKEYLKDMAVKIAEECNISQESSYTVWDFCGPMTQNFARSHIVSAVYPKVNGSHKLSVQLCCRIKNGELGSGLYSGSEVNEPSLKIDEDVTSPSFDDVVAHLKSRLSTYTEMNTKLASITNSSTENGWHPKKEEYDSGITKEKWLEILPELLEEIWGGVMAMFYTEKEGATCKTIANKFNMTFHEVRSRCTQLAKAVVKKTGCNVYEENGQKSYYPVLFYGKNTDSKDEGTFIWKLRPELYDALTEIDVLKWLPENKIEGETDQELSDYTVDNFMHEVYLKDEAEYYKLVHLLEAKKNLILKGAPGVGKTFVAKRLAYSILGKKKESNIKVVQFHQNYSYEDFVEGFKPKKDSDGFVLTDGVFKSFCDRARGSNEKYFFIIDEINRGNLSKIFGELLMLIEDDKRGKKEYEIELAYSKEPFSVPDNVYIIGMMNTADRSLALIDYALRRRFSFFDIEPKLDNANFQTEMNSYGDHRVIELVNKIDELNKNTIATDPALGKGFMIGHSYFCNMKADESVSQWLHRIVEYDIIPTLEEYWFDREKNVDIIAGELRKIIKDEPEQ